MVVQKTQCKVASLAVLWANCGSAVLIEGGPSTFGYDASSSCSKPSSRTARARLDLPCDFSRENWCAIAGNAYPWQAVRRFVQENQGLMRRMYGDEKHISVIKTEFERNDVELEFENEPIRFYYDDPNLLYRQFPSEVDYNHVAPRNEDRYGRSLNTGTSSKLAPTRNSHPNETPIAGYATSTATPADTIATTSASSEDVGSTSQGPQNSSTSNSSAETTTVKASPSVEPWSTTPGVPGDGTVVPNLVASLEQIANVQSVSTNEIGQPGQVDRLDDNVDELEETTTRTSTVPGGGGEEEEESSSAEVVEESAEASVSQYQEFRPRPRPGFRPTSTTTASASMEGQLYQEVASKDKQQELVLKVRGINACPVMEEVVAPFWANNTRGEMLALLNLYPFEQYVHWEKCSQENKQMYCRDGCRCEQQYRLHRLLAYDPSNECRGIFSDWFKFPSCCICRCYDLPLEFRVTSRSPRYTPRRKVKVRGPAKPPRQRQRRTGGFDV
ncbi:protein spaetzle 4-like [Copidosoma floridanum]|uniref:protein spaetzle 4-like n=1 Tax=Copidosoma floridanum TaxID=29053 RepID=UPI0006C9AC93|nr:protein spaetzle 4-like [Copidosoma floridanum]